MRIRTILGIVFGLLLLPVLTTQAATFELPKSGNDIVGASFTVKARSGDNLQSIGEDFGIGFHEMKEANPKISPSYVRSGQTIVVPAVFILPKYREGIVVNIAELRLYYFTHDGKHVLTYPVGLGRRKWRTPTADTVVTRKKENPTWYVPDSIRDFVFEQSGKVLPDFIPPGPENPLGKHAIYLSLSSYLIHGTNQPWTIGKLITSGCIRMYNADVADLFDHVQIGDKVRLVHHPYKVGWQNGVMYLEAHEPVVIDDPVNKLNILDADQVIQAAIKKRHADVEWGHVDYAVRQNRGIPYAIGNYKSYENVQVSHRN